MALTDGARVAEAFNELRRFHVYNHDEGEWWVSGVDFGGRAIIEFDDGDGKDYKGLESAETLVAGEPELQLVWEDGEDSATKTVEVDMEVAQAAADEIIEDLTRRLGCPADLIRVVSLEAPSEVEFLVLEDPLEDP